MTNKIPGRLLIGWLLVAAVALGQAPQGHEAPDPSCPNCAKGQGHPIQPIPQGGLQLGPQLTQDLPQGVSVESLPVGVPTRLPGPIDGHGTGGGYVEAEPEIPIPIVKLRIKAPACAAVGKEMEYRIKVENCTPVDAHNVTVKMSLPASVKILRASPQVHQREPELQWNLGTIPGFGGHDIVVLLVPIGLADIKSCTRVTFEHGQCVTTKVMALAPEGSADGRVPPGVIPGVGGDGFPGGAGGQGFPGGRGEFDVRVFGPMEASVGQNVTYKITVFNKGTRPVYKVGVLLDWGQLDFMNSSEKIIGNPPLQLWPEGLIDVLPPNSSRSLDLIVRSRGEGRFCVKVSGSASVSQDPNDNKTVDSKDEACTNFRKGIPGMTLEMFDREDPILKNGQTSFPITVRNQGKDPITNLRVKARLPDLLEMTEIRGPVRYKSGLDPRKEFWVEFEPLTSLNVGDTQTFEIFARGRGNSGDGRFHVEMTADQLDRGPNDSIRWIIEEESTTLVPDEETRARIREISRKMRENIVPGRVTSETK